MQNDIIGGDGGHIQQIQYLPAVNPQEDIIGAFAAEGSA